MYALLVLGVIALLALASLISALLVGQALLQSRLIETEDMSAQPASVSLNCHPQPLTA